MSTISNKIAIKAGSDLVWMVTVDIERWPQWNPNVTRIDRVDDEPLKPGSTVLIKQPFQPLSKWTIKNILHGSQFVWSSKRCGYRMQATHEIKLEGETTVNVISLEVRGVMSILLWPIIQYAVRRALSKENAALKKRCERLAFYKALNIR